MNKDIVNLAEECRSCTRYGKNVKYLISKNASKPLPLLTQPGQEVQLDYAGPIENQKGKKLPLSSYRSIFKISIGEGYEIYKWEVYSKILESVYRHTWNSRINSLGSFFRL